MKGPTVEELKERLRFGDEFADVAVKAIEAVDDPEALRELSWEYKSVRVYATCAIHDPYRSKAGRRHILMLMLDDLIDGYGMIEPLSKRFQYVNLGDPYVDTLIYDADQDAVFISAWGTLVEQGIVPNDDDDTAQDNAEFERLRRQATDDDDEFGPAE